MAKKFLHVLFLALLLGLTSAAQAFYDPTTGRWLNRDPLGDEAFLQEQMRGKPFEEQVNLQSESFKNPYRFVDNDPLNKFDPFGLAVVGIYGYGAADEMLGMQMANQYITSIAGATGGRAYGRSQTGSIQSYIKDEYKKDPKMPIVIFGYSRGAIAATEVANWVLKNKKDLPCARVFIVGIDPVTLTGPGPVRVPDKVEEFTSWYQKNGGGWGPWKVITGNLRNLDGTTMVGGKAGSNYLVTVGDNGVLLDHADMPGAMAARVTAAINAYKNRKDK